MTCSSCAVSIRMQNRICLLVPRASTAATICALVCLPRRVRVRVRVRAHASARRSRGSCPSCFTDRFAHVLARVCVLGFISPAADVLSYKAKTRDCVEPIRFAIDYRTKYADVLANIRAHGDEAVPVHKAMFRFNCVGMCG
jgi:hypothetical protein